jgi:hypothetical protein
MADCYLRKEIGSNVFKKMKDPAQSRYYNIKSAYYDYAWQYGVGQNVSQNKAYTPRGGAAGSGSSLPIDAFDQNATSMDKLREQMGTGKATTYIANIAKIDEELKGYVSTTRAKELKEEKDMNLKALYTMSRTPEGKNEVIGDLASVLKKDKEDTTNHERAVAYFEGMIENYGNSPTTGVPYASAKTEQADVYLQLKQWRDTPYLIDNSKDRAIIDSYINKIEHGHPILDKDLPELLTIVAKYNTPENHARSEENAYYASKKNELYDMLKGENNGLTPSQNNYYWTIYNNINKGYALDENQRDAMDKLYPEYRESVVKVDEKITSETEKTKTLLANSGKETNDEIIKGSIAKTLENSGKDEAKAYAMFLASSGPTDPGIPFRTNDDANVTMPNQTLNIGPKEENKSWFDQPGFSLNFQGVTLIDWNPVEWMYGSWDEYKQKQDLGQQQHEAAWEKWSENWIVNSLLLRNSEAWSKTITGTDPKTGEKVAPTRGDNLIVATDIASFIFSPYLEKATSWAVGKIAEKAGPYVDDITKTTSRFSTDTTARVPGGTKAAKEATEEVTEQTAKTLRADTLGNKLNNLAPEDRWALDKIRNIKTDIDTIGGKNYMRYTIGENRFNSIDDATTWVNVQRDILKTSGQADEAGKFIKAGTEELAKETIKTTSKEVTKETTKESGRLSLPIFKELPTWAKLSTAGFLFKEGLDLVGEYGFAGFITADTLMQFDSFPISDNMKDAKDPAAASAALWARQWKYDNLLEPQANKVAWIQDNLPILPQVFELIKPTWDTAKDSRDAYRLDGRRYSEQLAYRGVWKGDWESGRPASAEEIVAWYDANKNNKSIFPNSGAYDYNNAVPHSFYTNLKKDANARTEYNTRLNYMTFNEVNREIDKYNENVKIGRQDKLTTPEELKGKDDKDSTNKGLLRPLLFSWGTGLGVNQPLTGVLGKSVSDRINTLLGDKTLDSFQIKTLGETFKIPGIDKLNNLLSSDKIQEAKDYLSSKLAEVVPGYKPYEKSAWSTPGSNYKPDRSGICLSACQNACQTAQVYRPNNCGTSQFSAFNVGSGSGVGGSCGGGEAHGGGECREYGCEAVAESRAILCGEGGSCGSKQVVGCAACESALEALTQLRCGESSGSGGGGCAYDLSNYSLQSGSSAGGAPIEKTDEGNKPMEVAPRASACDQVAQCNEFCSQGEWCDSSDISAAEASCHGCETVWQMGCMSKELGMRKKK